MRRARRPARAPRAAAAVLLAALAACARQAKPAPAAMATARVTIDARAGARLTVTVEVARTPEQLQRGLMFRRELGADAGMLFVFPETGEHAFWMKNTLIPLDMIFLAEDGRIAGIVERAEPLTEINRTAGGPSRYVLEVNGGWAAAHGVRPGDAVRFEGVW